MEEGASYGVGGGKLVCKAEGTSPKTRHSRTQAYGRLQRLATGQQTFTKLDADPQRLRIVHRKVKAWVYVLVRLG